jgi:hypothetical protein
MNRLEICFESRIRFSGKSTIDLREKGTKYDFEVMPFAQIGKTSVKFYWLSDLAPSCE